MRDSPEFICTSCFTEFCYTPWLWNAMWRTPYGPEMRCHNCGHKVVYPLDTYAGRTAAARRDFQPVAERVRGVLSDIVRRLNEATA